MLGRCRIRSVGNTLNRAAGGRTGCRRCGSLAELNGLLSCQTEFAASQMYERMFATLVVANQNEVLVTVNCCIESVRSNQFALATDRTPVTQGGAGVRLRGQPLEAKGARGRFELLLLTTFRRLFLPNSGGPTFRQMTSRELRPASRFRPASC